MTETAELPVETFKEAAPHLRRPFDPAAVRFRVLRGTEKKALCAAYIDARLVIERLNKVIPHKWEHRFEPVQGGMRCDLTVDGLTRSDVGWHDNLTTDMGLKGLYSDALKRAAVHFGIGVSLYALPDLWLDVGPHVKRVPRQGGKDQFYVQPAGIGALRAIYKQWLVSHGRASFGESLGHGDVESVPDVPSEEPAPEKPNPKPAPAALKNARAALIREQGLTVGQIKLALNSAEIHGYPDARDDLDAFVEGLDKDQTAALIDVLVKSKAPVAA